MSFFIQTVLKSFIQDMVATHDALPEAAKLTIPEQARSYGLEFEALNVTTQDGYINELWHIWSEDALNTTKEPVFFMHGLLDSAGTWLFNEPEKAPAVILAQQGYDIWLGNSRGQFFSNKHVNLTTADRAFWDFSFHEMSMYDQPAFIDAVLERSGATKLKYVGHSQGTTQFFLANVMHDVETYGSKISGFVGLAPVLFYRNMSSLLWKNAAEHSLDLWAYKHFNSMLFMQPESSWFDRLVIKIAPTALTFIPRTTWAFVQGITGFDSVNHIDTERMPMMGRNDVGGTSTKNLAHWSQFIRSGKVETFAENEKERVEYDLEKMASNMRETKILLFRGTTDACVTKDDFSQLVDLLPAEQIEEVVTVDDYNHLDYMWAKNVDQTINPKLLDFLTSE